VYDTYWFNVVIGLEFWLSASTSADVTTSLSTPHIELLYDARIEKMAEFEIFHEEHFFIH
jgi:hypothetical protein